MSCVDSEDKNADKGLMKQHSTYWTPVCIASQHPCAPSLLMLGVVVAGWRGRLVAGASFYLGPAPAAGRLGDSSRHTQQLGFSSYHVYHKRVMRTVLKQK